MKLIRVHEFGGPEVLRYEEADAPTPAPGQVRVRILASGLNYIDTYHRSGQYKLPLPFTPGQEAAGVVDALGDGVTEFQLGDRVAFSSVMGTYAEAVIVPVAQLVPLPDDIDFDIAAAVLLQGMTAHFLANDTYPLHPGDVAVVTAAAGGVGALLVQIAKSRGARVIAAVSTEAKAAIAREAGADEVILYTETSLSEEVRRLTDGKGAHVVYDSVGKDTFDHSMDSLRPRGMLALYGQASGAVAPFDPQILNRKGSLFLTRPSLGAYTQTREELLNRAGAVMRVAADGSLKVRIHARYPLANATDAHRDIQSRTTVGKLLLIP